MAQPPAYTTTPEEYRVLPDDELREKIASRKKELGSRLVMLTHHYQRRDVAAFGDFRGDSYLLCKQAAQQEAEFIVFCGVHFMAESAVVLARPEQKVFLPNPLAGCPMADMAPIDGVLTAWEELGDYVDLSRVSPISYMNSAADLKAFCGRNRGAVCTSSNAAKLFAWAFENNERIFFFPDEHLGRNTANAMNVDRDQVYLWNPGDIPAERDADAIRRAKVILWKGYCHVHGVFRHDHVEQTRAEHPGVKIVVHPECTEEVVAAADAVGSTSFIVNYVEKQPPGSTIAIGTDLNLIDRLAHEHRDKTILELAGQTCAMCVNMFRTTLNDVAFTLDHVETLTPMSVPDDVAKHAAVALERMLKVAG
jgi:quinolinate synthase